MNRRGFFLIADLKWFLVFIIFAVLMLFIFFKPLHDKISNNITLDEIQNNDAQYLALSLPRMAVGDKQFSDVIRDVLDEPSTENLNTYKKFLNDTFTNSYIWTIYATETKPPLRYAIIVRQGNAYLMQTCAEYTYQGMTKSLCRNTQQNMANTQPVADPGDGGAVNRGYIPQSTRTLDKDTGFVMPNNPNTEIGTVYIPTSKGPVLLQVMIQRGQRP